MSHPWDALDDYSFVTMISDLLVNLGFIEIERQGSGPDGGIDLLATEPVSFAVQGRIPFRWAVQCKFSTKGTRSSISDQDIRDVEGILRSDRFASQHLRGYLLITNAKVSQNVVERLKGIDRHSTFRTAIIDGASLEQKLLDNPSIIKRALNRFDPSSLGKPLAVFLSADRKGVNVPRIEVKLGKTNDSKIPATAIIDTGATVSAIPHALARQLNLEPVSVIQMSSPTEVVEVHQYFILLEVEGVFLEWAEVVGLPTEDLIIGQNLLSRFVTVIYPDGSISFFSGPKSPK